MINNLPPKKAFFLLLILWFTVNLLQALYTEMTADEAYFLLYGKYLSWGYFDHPPVVALMVRISSLLFDGNLGMRFMTVLLQIATLVLIWKQLNSNHAGTKKVGYFFIISASLVMFSAYGFITAPDAPLLFFSALFFYGYKGFTSRADWLSVLIITIAMAGLIYSKYQGVLLILFVILSNLRLLRDGKFWLAAVAALVLVAPHFWWQYINDFPSFRYHLVQRSNSFKWRYLFEYLPNQLVVFNPFTFGAVIYVLLKYRPAGLYERALYFNITGLVLFFLVMSMRGHVEPHWTVAASIPMIILLTNKVFENKKLYNYVGRVVAPSLVLLVALRILLFTDLLPEKTGFSGKRQRFEAIAQVAGDTPVIFTGSFQKASLYTFFTGKPATVMSSLEHRQTQFDLWQLEQNWMGKQVFVPGGYAGRSQKYQVGESETEGFFADSFQTANRLKITFRLNQQSVVKAGDSMTISFTIKNPTRYDVNFDDPVFAVRIHPVFLQRERLEKTTGVLSQKIAMVNANSYMTSKITFKVPHLIKGIYRVGLSCATLFGPAANSNFEKITVQ